MDTIVRRPVGRASLAVQQRDVLRTEVKALKDEAREEIAALVPYAIRVHGYVQQVGESVEAEKLAAFVAAKLEQIAQRHEQKR